jgi:hypothetical protein
MLVKPDPMEFAGSGNEAASAEAHHRGAVTETSIAKTSLGNIRSLVFFMVHRGCKPFKLNDHAPGLS